MLLPLIGTGLYMLRYSDPDPLPRAAAIVVLSGPGGGQHPVPVDETKARVERGVALWRQGMAPLLVMSGGGSLLKSEGLSDSTSMAELARRSGVDPDAIREEGRSHSTLQNAWFTAELPDVDPSRPVIVVTHRYHLPRAWASLRWAGFRDVTLCAADPERGLAIDRSVLAEGIKWPFNLARSLAARLALFAGAPEASVLTWLE